MKIYQIHVKQIQERHFSRKKKPLREAAQRIWDFYPEKKAPTGGRTTDKGFLSRKKSAGGRTTDIGFLYIKSKIPRSTIQQSTPHPHPKK